MATTFRNQNLFCTNCGETHVLHYPIPGVQISKKSKEFAALHKDCKQTWVQPEPPDYFKYTYQRADFWWQHGERGSSSETMWKHLREYKNAGSNHPVDPDDFKRCYGLLKFVPEWKERLQELKTLSPQWSNLVDNWDKLTEMFETAVNSKSDKDYKKMYKFMQKLIK